MISIPDHLPEGPVLPPEDPAPQGFLGELAEPQHELRTPACDEALTPDWENPSSRWTKRAGPGPAWSSPTTHPG